MVDQSPASAPAQAPTGTDRSGTPAQPSGDDYFDYFGDAHAIIRDSVAEDDRIVGEIVATGTSLSGDVRVRQRLVEELRTLAGTMEIDIASRLSGSDRAWKALEDLHASGRLQPQPPNFGFDPDTDRLNVDLSAVNAAATRLPLAQKNLDRALFTMPGKKKALQSILTTLESARYGCLDAARSIEAETNDSASRTRSALGSRGQELARRRSALTADIDNWRTEAWNLFFRAWDQSSPATTTSFREPSWQRFSPQQGSVPVPSLMGTFHARHDLARLQEQGDIRGASELVSAVESFGIPAVLTNAWTHSIAVRFDSADDPRSLQEAFVRGFLIRQLAAFPPGTLRLGLADPVGVGQGFAPFVKLADHNQELISGKIRSSQRDMLELLEDAAAHIEHVVQTYLRGQFSTIAEYNEVAGEVAEPYRMLILLDFPNRFDDRMLDALRTVLEHGPRCGVYTVVSTTGTAPDPNGYGPRVTFDDLPHQALLRLDEMRIHDPNGRDLEYELRGYVDDPLAELGTEAGSALISTVVDTVGKASRGATVETGWAGTLGKYAEVVAADTRSDIDTSTVVPDPEDPATWWQNSAAQQVAAPLGRAGARNVAVATFDSGTHSGALLVGRPGSGKSTLIHTLLAGLTTLYSPQELRLYLLDFKEGVEFALYADEALPHAACVSIESERDFGLSVLRSVADEMKKRADLFKRAATPVTSYADYRAQGHVLERIVLVFDEFQVLFDTDDRIGLEAARLLEQIVRQGRGYGIHLLMSSQSLSGMPAIGRQVLQMLNVRILLPAAEEDGITVLGDRNPALRSISKRGEGILNPDAGAEASNTRFNTAFESEEDRRTRLRALRRRADESGFSARPRVFHSDVVSRLDGQEAEALARSVRDPEGRGATRLSFVPGHALRLSTDLRILLPREAGSHLAVVTKEAETKAFGFHAALIASTLAGEPDARISMLCFAQVTPGIQQLADELRPTGSFAFGTARDLLPTLEALVAELQRRQDEYDYSSPTELLILHGIHRARDLEDEGFGGFSMDDTPSAPTLLARLYAEGPDVGIHVSAWSDTVPSLGKRLSRQSLADTAFRFFSALGPDDLVNLTQPGVRAEVRDNQMAYFNTTTSEVEKYSPYLVDDPAVVGQVTGGDPR